ncbi:tRNA 5'-guanylyltransferase [[Phormidium ambiguum] IAM M-71]|uniref:tRNA(His) guanylyltransferase n=1 Tax=[Phormidium ambiguum] IAM M-71 TaxID=454136 RepID=A0A1U7I817_9CYAN|nr:tRNA(His) guanylyltransferase Thg1 family protein [Phormidium ambiguum]OKH32533.1 tRNA 5'-guanylyltransferase [Phormidium ambiguum IAM M-71]
MDNQSFENRMRELEYFHNLRLLPGAWVVVRVDSRSFSRFTETRFEKPFDLQFHQIMVQTAQALLEEMQGVYAYTESDEISVLFPPDWDFFGRSLEKVVSISASISSATMTHEIGIFVCFDSRVWLGVNAVQVTDYFSWRQADATRCALNGWCYWTMRKLGLSASQATAELDHQSVAFKNEFLFQNGINFNDLPTWQRRGTGLYWENYIKEGYNPINQQTVTTQRRRIKVDRELPMKEEYREFIAQFL